MFYQTFNKENLKRSRTLVFCKDFLLAYVICSALFLLAIALYGFVLWEDLVFLYSAMWDEIWLVLRVLGLASALFAGIINRKSWQAEQEPE